MKPRFALDLTHDAVGLLERTAAGWVRIGRALLDDPSLGDQLAGMRALAEARAPEGFTSKLILPNSQILYFETDAPGPDQASRRSQVEAALEGRTPYPIDELCFDFCRQGTGVKVAVVARETLQEAEDFAEAYGFRPVAFVAVPEPDRFSGEPFFGQTSRAARHLPAEGRLDRDQDPAWVISQAEAPLSALFRALPGLAAKRVTAAEGAALPPSAVPAADTQPEALGQEVPAADDANAPATEADAGPLAEGMAKPARPEPEEITPTQEADGETDPLAPPPAIAELAEADAPAPSLAASAESAAPPLHDEPAPPESAPAARIAEPAVAVDGAEGEAPFLEVTEDEAPPAPSLAAFQSRRSPEDATAEMDEQASRLATILPRLGGVRAQKPEAAFARPPQAMPKAPAPP
ncbi:MAG: hypothetical protein ORN49_13750, partial [Rhodobacteraceae bacterium]|nr:hypothetical protein [Paracoccaceae bacterium]